MHGILLVHARQSPMCTSPERLAHPHSSESARLPIASLRRKRASGHEGERIAAAILVVEPTLLCTPSHPNSSRPCSLPPTPHLSLDFHIWKRFGTTGVVCWCPPSPLEFAVSVLGNARWRAAYPIYICLRYALSMVELASVYGEPADPAGPTL